MTELRAALSRLRRAPGFALGAALSLAIGMSLGTALFSLVNSVRTRPLPYGDEERLGQFFQVTSGMNTSGAPARMVLELRAAATSFSHVAASTYRYATFVDGEQRTFLYAAAATPNYFEAAQVRPVLGRLFRTGDSPDQHLVVVSYEFWQSKLGGDSNVVGRSIDIEARESGGDFGWRVLGVLPPKFGIYGTTPVWFLLDDAEILREASDPKNNIANYAVLARRKAGVSPEAADVQVATLFKRLYRGDPIRGDRSGHIVPVRTLVIDGVMGSLQLWTAAALLILILCAVNFATMSLARGLRRRSELAVRAALGASRLDLVREIVTEALALSAVSGALSVLVAWWLMSYAAQLLGGWLPVEPSTDWAVLAFGVGSAMVVGFVFSVAPAVELAKVDLRSVLQGHTSAVTAKGREVVGQRLLVALQLSLAVTAVATITAVMQADRRFYVREAAFDYQQIVFVDVSTRDTTAHIVGESVRERLAALPGVVRVASTWWASTALVFDNAGEVVDVPQMLLRYATPNLFEAVGSSLVAGRLPTEEEARSGTGFVASATLARKMFGTEQAAVGKRVKVKLRGKPRDWTTIVGVAPDLGGLWSWGVSATLYALQRPEARTYSQYIVAVSGDAKVRARDIEKAVRGVDSRLIVNSRSATADMAAAVGATRGRYYFLMGVAGLALVLAIVGVYGMTSYATEVRLRDYGIRLALGANATRLLQVMFADTWWMAPLGVGVGVLAAGRLTAYLDAMYRNPMMKQPLVVLHVGPTSAAAAALIAIAILGTSLPLRRVLKMDVMRTVQGGG